MFRGTLSLVFVFCCLKGSVGECQNGWVRFDDSCYKFLKNKERWVDAKDKCKSIGAALATVESSDENVFLKEFLQDVASCDKAWVGGTDLDKEGTWKWVTGELFNYTSWIQGEPDSHNGWEEDCLCFRPDGWADYSCSDEFSFVCEKVSPRGTCPGFG